MWIRLKRTPESDKNCFAGNDNSRNISFTCVLIFQICFSLFTPVVLQIFFLSYIFIPRRCSSTRNYIVPSPDAAMILHTIPWFCILFDSRTGSVQLYISNKYDIFLCCSYQPHASHVNSLREYNREKWTNSFTCSSFIGRLRRFFERLKNKYSPTFHASFSSLFDD